MPKEWRATADLMKTRTDMKQQPTKDQMAEYLISNILDHLVVFIMEDEGIGLEESLDKVYGSEVIKQLQDKETELYVQSPAYVYEMMNSQRPL